MRILLNKEGASLLKAQECVAETVATHLKGSMFDGVFMMKEKDYRAIASIACAYEVARAAYKQAKQAKEEAEDGGQEA